MLPHLAWKHLKFHKLYFTAWITSQRAHARGGHKTHRLSHRAPHDVALLHEKLGEAVGCRTGGLPEATGRDCGAARGGDGASCRTAAADFRSIEEVLGRD